MYLVYAHIDPRNGLPFYIGKGNKRRSSYILRTNQFHRNVVSQIRLAGLKPIIEILHTCESEEEAFEKEILEISFYGRRDLGTGFLVNHTDGGDGPLGMRHSDEFKSNLSERMKGNKFGRGRPKGSTGYGFRGQHSEETKIKMRASRAKAVAREAAFYLGREFHE